MAGSRSSGTARKGVCGRKAAMCLENGPQKAVDLKSQGENFGLDLASGGHYPGVVRLCSRNTALTSVGERPRGGETQTG